MEKYVYSRSFLESLSTSDLISLADDNGIDIPEGLNRRFIIGELLEIKEDHLVLEADIHASASGPTEQPASLPDTYNETSITALLRDPGWIFVYWDFHAPAYTVAVESHAFESFFLRINTISEINPNEVVDFFDIDIGLHDRKWYVHFPESVFSCRIDLCARFSHAHEQVFAKSLNIMVPCSKSFDNYSNQKRRESPILELSDILELRRYHFRNHRQSFGSQ